MNCIPPASFSTFAPGAISFSIASLLSSAMRDAVSSNATVRIAQVCRIMPGGHGNGEVTAATTTTDAAEPGARGGAVRRGRGDRRAGRELSDWEGLAAGLTLRSPK